MIEKACLIVLRFCNFELNSHFNYQEKVSKIRAKQAAMPGWEASGARYSLNPAHAPSPASVR